MNQERFISTRSSLNQRPRIFIGTMYSGEGDFFESIRSVKEQVDVNITYHIISHLAEKDAHNALWTAWCKVRSEHDLFVKIDADTILRDSHTLKTIYEIMYSTPDVTGIQCPLYDYFSDDLINGLNCFSPEVKFRSTDDPLYCDRVDYDHKIVLRQGSLPAELSPAGYHCTLATELQAFHYGLHRMLKNQKTLLARVRSAWIGGNKDRTRGMALLGANHASQFAAGSFNYTDVSLMNAFNNAVSMYDQMIAVI